MPDKKKKNIHIHASRYTFLLNPPHAGLRGFSQIYSCVLAQLLQLTKMMLLQQQYLVLPVNLQKGIFLTVSQHFVLQKKEKKGEKRSPRHWQLREILERSSNTPNLRYKINVVQFGGKR